MNRHPFLTVLPLPFYPLPFNSVTPILWSREWYPLRLCRGRNLAEQEMWMMEPQVNYLDRKKHAGEENLIDYCGIVWNFSDLKGVGWSFKTIRLLNSPPQVSLCMTYPFSIGCLVSLSAFPTPVGTSSSCLFLFFQG